MYEIKKYQISLGKAIRCIRKEQKLTQEDLALSCESHQHYISEIETGNRNITISSIILIANQLDIKLGFLFASADTYMEGCD